MRLFELTHVRTHLPYALRVHSSPDGSTHYMLINAAVHPWRVLLELQVERDGRMLDYLKLDTFWGHVPRPLDVNRGCAGAL